MEPPAFDPEIDATTKMINPRAIAECSIALADAIGPLLVGREVPVVLGGDCTILLGCTLAMDRTLERPAAEELDGFLANPQKLRRSEHLEDCLAVLKLVFAEKLAYARDGAIEPPKS